MPGRAPGSAPPQLRLLSASRPQAAVLLGEVPVLVQLAITSYLQRSQMLSLYICKFSAASPAQRLFV